MLLIDDGQAEVVEVYTAADERVSPDDNAEGTICEALKLKGSSSSWCRGREEGSSMRPRGLVEKGLAGQGRQRAWRV